MVTLDRSLESSSGVSASSAHWMSSGTGMTPTPEPSSCWVSAWVRITHERLSLKKPRRYRKRSSLESRCRNESSVCPRIWMREGTMPWKCPTSASPDFWMRACLIRRSRPASPASGTSSTPRPGSERSDRTVSDGGGGPGGSDGEPAVGAAVGAAAHGADALPSSAAINA